MRRPLIAGNWKMHGSKFGNKSLLSALVAHASELSLLDMVVFPPYVYLAQTAAMLAETSISVGAQDVSAYAPGAYTGEVSADMLVDVGCQYVIVGHSERRHGHSESNADVAKKFVAALNLQLIPILCVGETAAEREQNKTAQVVSQQLAVALSLADNLRALRRVVIAYEPVWAIGTGNTATPEQAQQVHALLRQQLCEVSADLASEVRIVYGGSVKPGNAKQLFAMPDIDGALVGGASLEAEQFLQIAKNASE